MVKKGKIAILINIICCIVVLFLSIGYSSFSKKITADEIAATVRIEKEIRVNNIALSSTSGGAVSSWEEYNFDSIEGRIILPSSSSSVIYTVDILNLSNKEYGILSITGLREELDYELLDYNLEEKICDGAKCTLGVTKPIKIKIKYKSGMFSASNNEFNFKLNFDFRTYHNINYVDITSTNLPKKIIDGGRFNLTITPGASKGIEVKRGDLVLVKDVDYTYNNNNLVINNIVNDDITITNLLYPVGEYISLGTEGFYVIGTDESADKLIMLAEWNLNVGRNPVEGTSGMQNSACKGYVGTTTSYCTLAFSSTNYWKSSSISNPTWVYNEQSILYPHVENYVNELKKLGYNNVTGRIIKYEELVSLGCTSESKTCSSAPLWLIDTTFWVGSAYDSNYVWNVVTSGRLVDNHYSDGRVLGVRPVIEISTSEI